MALSSYPFDGQTTTETQYSQLFRELQDTGVVPTLANAYQASGDGSGMTVKIQAGFALVRGFAVLSTAIDVVTLPAAEAQPRIDRIVLRLNPALNSIVTGYVKGTAGTGAAPALNQTDTDVWEMPLALVNVGANVTNIGALDVTDDRRYVGTRIRQWTTTTRPTTPRLSQLGLNTTRNAWEFWNGTAWTDLAPTVTWSTITGAPTTFAPAPHRHDWNDLDNMPSSFTPSAHTHAAASINTLATALSQTGKLDSDLGWLGGESNKNTLAIANINLGLNASGGPAGFNGLGLVSKGSSNAISLRWDGRFLARVDNTEWELASVAYVNANAVSPSGTVARADGTSRAHAYQVGGGGTYYAVWVDGSGNFGRNTSSLRYKENVRDIEIDPKGILDLRPVVYDRKATADPETGEMREGNKDEFGLIAEEVYEHLPEIVTFHDGLIDAVRYDLLGVALLKVVQDQEKRIAALESR